MMILAAIVVGIGTPVALSALVLLYKRKATEESEVEFLSVRITCSKCGHVGGFVRKE